MWTDVSEERITSMLKVERNDEFPRNLSSRTGYKALFPILWRHSWTIAQRAHNPTCQYSCLQEGHNVKNFARFIRYVGISDQADKPFKSDQFWYRLRYNVEDERLNIVNELRYRKRSNVPYHLITRLSLSSVTSWRFPVHWNPREWREWHPYSRSDADKTY
jgi:hypothetical protein